MSEFVSAMVGFLIGFALLAIMAGKLPGLTEIRSGKPFDYEEKRYVCSVVEEKVWRETERMNHE